MVNSLASILTPKFIIISMIIPLLWAFFGKQLERNLNKFNFLHWLFLSIGAAFLAPIIVLDGIKALIGFISFIAVGLPVRYFLEKK